MAKLEYDLGKGRILEWAKAIGPWFTSLGIAATLWLGLSQLQQTQRARDDERFERSVTRLGSQQSAERLTGLAGLEQFLKSTDAARQESTLLFIVNAAVIERDDTVREALLDSLDRLDRVALQKSALDSALGTARDRNRALLKRLRDSFWKSFDSTGKWPSGPDLTEVPIGNPQASERASLYASSKAIASIIRAGGYVEDLSQIYCVECVFSIKQHPAQLQRVNFDGAFLRRAKFQNALLSEASFNNADLIGTSFYNANLNSAKITEDLITTPWQVFAMMASGTTLALQGADFGCSDLSLADFSGRAVFSVLHSNPVPGSGSDGFRNANLTGTKFDNIQFLIGFPREIVDAAGKDKFDFRKSFPVLPRQWAGPEQLVHSVKGSSDYYFYTVATGPEFKFEGTFDPRIYWDFIMFLRNLNDARNLDKAVLSKGLKGFIDNNQALMKISSGKSDCSL